MNFAKNFRDLDGEAEALLEAVFDSLPCEVALLDRGGVVVAANARWIAQDGNGGVGASFAGTVRRRWGADDRFARQLLEGVEAVLAGRTSAFALSCPCDGASTHGVASIEARRAPSSSDWVVLTRSVVAPACGEPAEPPSNERALRAREARQAFLVTLGDRLRSSTSAEQVREIACRSLGEQLGADRVFLVEAEAESQTLVVSSDYCRAGLESIVGRYCAADFPEAGSSLETRAPLVIRDGAGDDGGRLGRGALIVAPHSCEDGSAAALNIFSRVARSWAEEEVALVVDVAGRACEAAKRALAEAAMRESEQREKRRSAELQALLDTAPIGLAIALDPRGERIRGNRAQEQIFGLAPGAELSMVAKTPPGLRVFHEGRELSAGEMPMQRAVRGEVVAGEIIDVLCEGGRTLTAFAKAMPLYDEDGNPRGAVGAFMDITKIKRAEDALRESEQRFRSLVESYAQSVWEADRDGVIVEDSQTWRASAGQNPGDPWAAGWLGAVHPDDRESTVRRWRAAVASRQLYDAECRLQYQDGGWRWTNVRATPILSRDGEVLKWTGMNVDIEARKQAEAALRESEARLEQALAAANAGVWEFVPSTGAFEASARAKALHGLAPDSLLDRDRALATVHIEDQPRILKALENSIEAGAPFKAELRARQPDGSLRWLSSIAELRGSGENLRLVGLVQDIDERKRGEFALRESEERQAFLLTLTDALRQIVDAGEIQGAACRLLAEYLDVNRVSYSDIDGQDYIVRQSHARGVAPFMVRMPIADLGEKLLELYRRGETVAIEDVFAEEGFAAAERERFKAGEIVALASVILTKQGRWVGALCVHNAAPRAWSSLEMGLVREVAERIWSSAERARAQTALRESEFRLQLALNSGNIGIYEWRLETGELIWDDRLRAIWGLHPSAPLDFPSFMQGVHPADRDCVQDAVGRALDPAGRGSLYVEYRVVGREDRAERWVAATGAVFFEDGRPIRMVGTAQDVTERKLAEAERQKFVSLAEQSIEFIGICTLEFEPLYVNAAGARLVGLDRERVPATPVAEYFFPEDRNLIFTDFFERVQRNGHANVEVRFRHFVTGEALWMLYNVFVLRDQRGEAIGYATVSSEITERKRVEDALKAADRRKDEFLATLAHELRNPLAPIRNAVHVLHHDARTTMKSKRDLALLSMIDRQVDHLISLVDDLLEVSRITRGKVELKKRRVDIAEILCHAVETAQPTIDQGQHRLRVELPLEPLELDADPVRLAQVFTNLLNNAAKYTEQGGDIGLMAERRGGEAVVTVRDSGVGIPVEMLPRVFDLFTQVDRTLGRAQGGLGIGLALVKSLLDLHGGSVEARSDGLGCGSAFIVRLPTTSQKPTEEPMPATSPELRATRRILVIDDDHDVADSLVMFLETFGATVQVAYSGAAGLEALEAFKPELVFLDLGMPGMDGYETARRIRALPAGRGVQLVALTGWGQEQIYDRAREAGFDRQLTKPAGFEALQELLGTV